MLQASVRRDAMRSNGARPFCKNSDVASHPLPQGLCNRSSVHTPRRENRPLPDARK
jgi:hypothetical protein